MSRRSWTTIPVAALAAAALALSACGGGDDSGGTSTPAPSTSTPTATTPTTAESTVEVAMNEFNFIPKDATATAGKITINAPNQGKVVHELVLVKTDKAATDLPQANGEVDEDAIPPADIPGEIADVPPGETKSLTVTLPAGRYVMICNVPGHFAAGMYGTFTVS